MICARCGISADYPAECELTVNMGRINILPQEGARIPVAVTNCTERRMRGSVATQFHDWRSMGISVDKDVVDFDLAPRETFEREFVFKFARPFGDYIQDIHVFTLTDKFALSCFTQKMMSRHAAVMRKDIVSVESVRSLGQELNV